MLSVVFSCSPHAANPNSLALLKVVKVSAMEEGHQHLENFVGYPNFIIIVQSFHIHNHHNIIYYLHLYILIYYIHKIVLYNAVE